MWTVYMKQRPLLGDRCVHGRTQPKIARGQSEVQKGTLLLMMIMMHWHKKKGTCSQKGHFSPRLPGGSSPPCPPPLGTALVCC